MANLEGLEGLSPEEKAERLVEMYKKLESDTDRGIQKVRQQFETVEAKLQYNEEAKKVAKDNEYLVELQKSNPQLAEKICSEEYGIDLQTALDKLGKKEPSTVDYDAIVNAKIEERSVKEAIKEFKERANLEGDQLKEFEKEFAELTEGKKLTGENVKKYLKISLKEVVPDYNAKEMEAKSMSM
jgi:exonuclease VII large subunit